MKQTYPLSINNSLRIIALSFLLVCAHLSAVGQAYLGRISCPTTVNMRSGPGKDYDVVKALKNGTQVFVSSRDDENGFFNIIDIKTNREGYVHKSFIRLGQIVEASTDGIFNRQGESSSEESELEVYNRSSKQLTLKLNTASYSFAPYQRKTISLPAASYSFRASAPGVVPYIGTDRIDTGGSYNWEFYIVTSYR
jgi:hypothetical protein